MAFQVSMLTRSHTEAKQANKIKFVVSKMKAAIEPNIKATAGERKKVKGLNPSYGLSFIAPNAAVTKPINKADIIANTFITSYWWQRFWAPAGILGNSAAGLLS